MDTRTGKLYDSLESGIDAGVPRGNLIKVTRPLTVREETRGKINKYAPCACGSGKKFKFCCYKP